MNLILQKTLIVIFIIVAFLTIIYLVDLITKSFFQKLIDNARSSNLKKRLTTLRTVLVSFATVIFATIGFFFILGVFGINFKHLIATAGIVGLAIGFCAKQTVEDLIAGASILVNNQIMVGDVIKICGICGTVEKINLKMVVLRDTEGALHFFRNSFIEIITNYTRDFSYSVFELPICYNENVTNVVNIIKELGSEIKETDQYKKIILDELEILGLDKFLDNAFLIKFRIKTKPGKQWEITRAFNLRIKEKFEEANISFPRAQITVVGR